MKKLRADAVENKLTVVERDELAAIIAANAPLKEIVGWFESHGFELSIPGAARVHKRLTAAQQRLATRAATIKAMRDVAAKHGITLTEAALDTATSAVGDLLDAQIAPETEEGQQLLLKALTGLTGARSVEVRAKLGARAQDQTDRKLALLEKRDAASKKVIENPKLTPAEKEAEMKRILGVGA